MGVRVDRIEDTYFSDSFNASEVAKQQNIFGPYENLQICYYDGEKISSKYKNLIHLPKNKITEILLSSQGRVPTKFEINPEDEDEIYKEFEKFKTIKNKLHLGLLKEIKKMRLDFNEPLRIYMSADYGGKVVLKIYELLKDVFEENGYQVYYDFNNEITLMDDYRRAKAIHEFRPHITININRIRNEQLCDDMFNFIWFLDPTLILYDETKIYVRDRDYFFYLGGNLLKNALKSKNVCDSKIFPQSFATNHRVFYIDETVKRENKIVFIGNNYFEVVSPTLNYKNETDLIDSISTLFNQSRLTIQEVHKLATRFYESGILKREEHLEMFIVSAVIRIEILKWICAQNMIKVEIYGKGWENIEEIKPFHKGSLAYEKEIRDVCNSAKYSLLAHPEYYYQQRLMESSACGSIPVIYNWTENSEVFHHQDYALMFCDKESLYETIGKEPLKLSREISEDMSYDEFMNRMINLVKENI